MTKECPRRIPKRAANSYRYKSRDSLDRIRNIRYVLLLTESLPARRLPGRGEEKPLLFDNPPDHNPRASSRGGGDFLISLARNPLKRLDSEK
jgi:hypothetical protein